jgi:uncharacterized Zn-binding protein involved in type VI secretion
MSRIHRPAAVAARVRRRRRLTVLTAMAAAAASWAIAVPLMGADLVVQQGSEHVRINGLAVTLTGLAAGLGGWLLLALLERWTARARIAWRTIASLVLLVSLLGPPAAVGAPATAVLTGLHLLVGAILIVGLPAAGVPHPAPSPAGARAEPEPHRIAR